jgi:diacylglycerol kinase family enzyme
LKFRAILNRDGGTLRTMDLDAFCTSARTVFEQEGHELDCRVIAGKSVEAELRKAAHDSDVDIVLAGGGDGTISAAAAMAFKSGKPLAILPAGTMNLFARALGMPLDLDQALVAVARGRTDRIDVATANGQPFVHQFGVGIHARLVRIRNGMTYGSRVGKMLASFRAILAAAVNPPRFEVELHTPEGTRTVMASGIAISNNPLDDSPVPIAATLTAGVLGVYIAQSVTTNELLNLAFDVMTGRWRNNAAVSEAEVRDLVLRFPKRKRGTHAVIDGELIDLESAVTLQIHPRALPVVLPGKDAVQQSAG